MASVKTVGKHEAVLLNNTTSGYIYIYTHYIKLLNDIHTFDLKLVDSISTSPYLQTSESVQK